MKLVRQLDVIAERAHGVLALERARASLGKALECGVFAGLFAAVLCSRLPLGAGWILVLVGAVAVLGFASALGVAAMRQPSRGEALTAVDERLGLKDRLRTAADFLAQPTRTPFMAAALADAEPAIEHARRARLPLTHAPIDVPRRVLWYALALPLVVTLAILFGPSGAAPAGDADTTAAGQKTVPAGPRPSVADLRARPTEREEIAANTERRRSKGSARRSKGASRVGEDVKKAHGSLGAGQSSDAASASGASLSRGAPSSQAQQSLAPKKQDKKKKKPRKAKPDKDKPDPQRRRKERSGATAGRGAASGSSRSPSASTWASKDQVTSDDEEDLEDDEDVDDEVEDQEARGGLQPRLRDRKPPVNRDLGIGFGNQKNPDANGRGGPSQQKKSRGVASLVLGVSIPDHVKGKPNPGKTKITQERVDPRAEQTQAVDSSARMPRANPLGYLHRQDLSADLRNVIRDYYRLLRQKTAPRETDRDNDRR